MDRRERPSGRAGEQERLPSPRPPAAPKARPPLSPSRLLAVHHGGGIGGAPVSLLKLLSALDSACFDARALFTERGPILDYACDLGVPAHVLSTEGALFYSAHARLTPRTLARFLRTFPAAVQRAQGELRRERPDVLHLNTSVLLAWAAAARRERVPVLWMVREVLGPNPVLRRWHARYIQCHASRIVATSDAVRACFLPEAEVHRVYNAVDLDEFSPGLVEARPLVRAELGLALDEAVVMALGSVQREKGHWLLLDTLEVLVALQPRTRLVLVCGGADAAYATGVRGRLKRTLGLPLDNLDALLREAAQRGLANWMVVTGYRRDIPRLLAASDVLVFPSLAPEGFGRPIVEAMAMARPVVATDVGPSREILGPEAGLLVPPQPRELANALATLLESPALREQLGRAGRARVETLFSLDRQVAEMAALYHEAACLA